MDSSCELDSARWIKYDNADASRPSFTRARSRQTTSAAPVLHPRPPLTLALSSLAVNSMFRAVRRSCAILVGRLLLIPTCETAKRTECQRFHLRLEEVEWYATRIFLWH